MLDFLVHTVIRYKTVSENIADGNISCMRQ